MSKLFENFGAEIEATTTLGSTAPDVVAVGVVNIVLSLLAVMAALIVLYAGFMWMTAGGNSEKIDTARSWLTRGVIGLAIIMASWGIVRWLAAQLNYSTGADSIHEDCAEYDDAAACSDAIDELGF